MVLVGRQGGVAIPRHQKQHSEQHNVSHEICGVSFVNPRSYPLDSSFLVYCCNRVAASQLIFHQHWWQWITKREADSKRDRNLLQAISGEIKCMLAQKDAYSGSTHLGVLCKAAEQWRLYRHVYGNLIDLQFPWFHAHLQKSAMELINFRKQAYIPNIYLRVFLDRIPCPAPAHTQQEVVVAIWVMLLAICGLLVLSV
jgi:hypothetical protein